MKKVFCFLSYQMIHIKLSSGVPVNNYWLLVNLPEEVIHPGLCFKQLLWFVQLHKNYSSKKSFLCANFFLHFFNAAPVLTVTQTGNCL